MSTPRFSLMETLESRRLMSVSADTLAQDQTALTAAKAQYAADKATSITVLAADRAKIVADGKGVSDPAAAQLINTWKQAILTRDNTLLTDRTALKTATNNDKIAVLKDHAAIHADKAAGNTTQLALDKATLQSDLLKLTTDHTTLGTTLANDAITTKATIAADHMAIIAQKLADGGNTQKLLDRQQLVSDSVKWGDTLNADHKVVLADQLKVSQDEHG